MMCVCPNPNLSIKVSPMIVLDKISLSPCFFIFFANYAVSPNL